MSAVMCGVGDAGWVGWLGGEDLLVLVGVGDSSCLAGFVSFVFVSPDVSTLEMVYPLPWRSMT